MRASVPTLTTAALAFALAAAALPASAGPDEIVEAATTFADEATEATTTAANGTTANGERFAGATVTHGTDAVSILVGDLPHAIVLPFSSIEDEIRATSNLTLAQIEITRVYANAMIDAAETLSHALLDEIFG